VMAFAITSNRDLEAAPVAVLEAAAVLVQAKAEDRHFTGPI
jgi:hypothetical protein